MDVFYAEVIVPLPLPNTFTYSIPYKFNGFVSKGTRVLISFGRKKVLTGIVYSVHINGLKNYKIKPILDVLDSDYNTCKDKQLEWFKWIAEYYMCTVGDVIRLALPAGLKISTESVIKLNGQVDFSVMQPSLNENEAVLVKYLRKNKYLYYNKINNILSENIVLNTIKSLVEKKIVSLVENLKSNFKPKREKFVSINNIYIAESNKLKDLLSKLEKFPKQLHVLLAYLKHIPILKKNQLSTLLLRKLVLIQEKISNSALNTLIKKGILEEKSIEISRLEHIQPDKNFHLKLSNPQSNAIKSIYHFFESKQCVLLHGVTGSGKTEIYIKLIKDALEGGGQILYLLPEISLTVQIVSRLRKVFGDVLNVYHSKYSNNERVEVWNKIVKNESLIVIGTRSSIFLPFANLSLIIIDEEHDPSYKQNDRYPRYHARDAALVLALYHKSKVILGSATPSVESFYNCRTNKYGYVNLTKRYTNVPLPEIKIVKLQRGIIKNNEISQIMIDEIESTISDNKQVIIFQNRRGYAPFIECEDCAWIPQCSECSVKLTYHQYINKLSCHYCGKSICMVNQCKKCESFSLKKVSFGTEKIEETLKYLIPQGKVLRMDLDTTRKKKSFENIIENFEQGKTNILVGTQMVTKGFDFSKVHLVGIPNIDKIINIPDFRALERCFQLSTQVIGRSGRREKRGKVLIQTYDQNQEILKQIITNDYLGMYKNEISERKIFFYPPISKLITIVLKHKSDIFLQNTASVLYRKLKNKLGKKVSNPYFPYISKIKKLFIMNIVVKLENNNTFVFQAKNNILNCVHNMLYEEPKYKTVQIFFDVDPY